MSNDSIHLQRAEGTIPASSFNQMFLNHVKQTEEGQAGKTSYEIFLTHGANVMKQHLNGEFTQNLTLNEVVDLKEVTARIVAHALAGFIHKLTVNTTSSSVEFEFGSGIIKNEPNMEVPSNIINEVDEVEEWKPVFDSKIERGQAQAQVSLNGCATKFATKEKGMARRLSKVRCCPECRRQFWGIPRFPLKLIKHIRSVHKEKAEMILEGCLIYRR